MIGGCCCQWEGAPLGRQPEQKLLKIKGGTDIRMTANPQTSILRDVDVIHRVTDLVELFESQSRVIGVHMVRVHSFRERIGHEESLFNGNNHSTSRR